MTTFEQYLKDFNIQPIRLSIEAGVRYVTVYNAVKEKPVSYDHAQKIRVALQRLTGHVYAGPLPIITPQSVDQLPTLPIRKIPKNS